jgi:hypothetical protein
MRVGLPPVNHAAWVGDKSPRRVSTCRVSIGSPVPRPERGSPPRPARRARLTTARAGPVFGRATPGLLPLMPGAGVEPARPLWGHLILSCPSRSRPISVGLDFSPINAFSAHPGRPQSRLVSVGLVAPPLPHRPEPQRVTAQPAVRWRQVRRTRNVTAERIPLTSGFPTTSWAPPSGRRSRIRPGRSRRRSSGRRPGGRSRPEDPSVEDAKEKLKTRVSSR